MPVDFVRKDVRDMQGKWQRLRDCFGGRDDVLARGTEYVPKLGGLDVAGNEAYRSRGSFYNAVCRTVQGLTGAIFQKTPTFKVPKFLEPELLDVTLSNVSMEMFSVTAGQEVMLVGRYGILVEMVEEVTQTLLRPYLVGFKAEDIINWKMVSKGGDQVLSMVVLRSCTAVPDPDDYFVDKDVEQFRVIALVNNQCIQQIWQRDAEKKWAQVGSDKPILRRGVALDFIPFVFIGAMHVTPEVQKPPLIDLADVNLAHWRNSVDYEYGLHLVALPTPWVSGLKAKGPTDQDLAIGPAVIWELEKEGKAGMLEFTGAGLETHERAMTEKKAQMASLGARMLDQQPATEETATAVRMRHGGDHATLRTCAQALEQGLSMSLQFMTWWSGTDKLPADVEASCELNKDYLNIKATPQEVQVALTMLQADQISYKTFWNILVTGGWSRDGVSSDDELKEIFAQEKPDDPQLAADAAALKLQTDAAAKLAKQKGQK